jgi:N utilization substance protein B
MQAIYEHRTSRSVHVDRAEKSLVQTFDNMYKLYLQVLAIFGALTYAAEQIIEIKKQKLLPTETDIHPNYKFVNNLFIKKISGNVFLKKGLRKYNIGWQEDLDLLFIRKLYDQLAITPVFVEYMQSTGQTFERDKEFVIDVVEKFLLENEDICNYLGEKYIHWQHDYNDAVILVYNTLKIFSRLQRLDNPLPPLFKTDQDGVSEDRQFMLDLFRKTIEHNEEFVQMITPKLINWEQDRVANIDFILLKMAICEMCYFPSIPVRVTLNEYIEISKYYSTPKSRNFINGMLDGILLDLRKEDKINKQGRGLMG